MFKFVSFNWILFLGLLDLYQSTFNESYLAWAIDLQDQQIKLFYDEQGGGGFFNVGEDTKNILVRLKDGKYIFFKLYYLYKVHYINFIVHII
jgi:hypothetical protein